MDVHVRPYESNDLPSVQRIWREVGWVDERQAEHLEDFLADAHTVVTTIDGEAEAATSIHDAVLEHTGTPLPLAAVTSVTTSRIGRKQGLARATLRQALSDAVERGMAVCALGMFDQGFYDTVGFGTGAEQVFLRTDPAHLSADLPHRRPVRLTLEDVPDLVGAHLARDRPHGAVTFASVPMRRAERSWDDDGFGLGHRDEDGRLTHYVWCDAGGEHGPYRVKEWAWRTPGQLRELLGVLRSLGDQVRTVVIPEPARLQLQVLVDRPGRLEITRTTGEHRHAATADAWWQARILDVPACVAALSAARRLHCNLRLTDPLDLPQVAGNWVLQLGEESEAVPGHDANLPVLVASVNAFTRLWLGVRPATTLAATDDLDASPQTLAALDDAIRLPRPDVAMDF